MRDSAAASSLQRCLECGHDLGVTEGAPARRLCAQCAMEFCPHCRERYRRHDGGASRCVCGQRRH